MSKTKKIVIAVLTVLGGLAVVSAIVNYVNES